MSTPILLLMALLAADGEPPRAVERAAVIPVEGMITPLTRTFIERKLKEARSRGADLVVLDIDSPGGVVRSTFEITELLQDVDWARTVAFVDREALSGAAIIALATDRIVIAPRARFGDAGPIVMGEDALYRHAPEKIRSDLVVRLRDLAEAGGRPPALAEAMADTEAVVFEAVEKESGRRVYFTEDEWESREDADRWERGKPVFETRQGNFLTVNGLRATALGLADDTAEDLDRLFDSLGVPAERVVHLDASWVDTTVWVLNWPLVTILLVVIGIAALGVELSAPGFGVGGLISLLCFGLFFWSRFLGGTSGWLEVVLFTCGLVFVAAELFVIPGFGVAGIGGGLLIFTSLVMASQHAWFPESPRDLRQLGESALTVLAAMVVLGGLALVAGKHIGGIPVLHQLTLAPPPPDSEVSPAASVVSGGDGGVPPTAERPRPGEVGTSVSQLRPAGKVQFGDELIDVVTEGDFVESGRQVRVIQKLGARVVVRAV